ncbi:hypothetical protein ACWCQP_50610 [Streptomyces chartreusis]
MAIRWGAFSLFLLGIVVLAWGVADSIDVAPCIPGRWLCGNESGNQDNSGRNILLIYDGSLALFLGFYAAGYVEDWRPTLGLPVGALTGSIAALSMDQGWDIWIFAIVLLVVCVAVPILMRMWMRCVRT